jgi:Xaa-Pro aminopeptidase
LSAVSPERYVERLRRAREALAAAGAATLLVGVGPDLEWLTGYAAVGHERLNLLVLVPGGEPVFLGPRLERGAAEQAPGIGGRAMRLVTWEEHDDPYRTMAALLAEAAPAASLPGRELLVSDGLRATFVLGLQRVLPAATWGLASTVLAPLRRVKDPEEVVLLRSAAEAADRVIATVAAGPLIGRREAEVAAEVRRRLVDEGHDTAEFAIVASGPNSASPHHDPGDRVIRAGEPLLLDIGGRRRGYCSDTTRTFWVGGQDGQDHAGPDPEFAAIHDLTVRAQAAGRAAARPGATFSAIDAAARDVIAAAGHGSRFFHRLGHGIGLEVHEDPYVIAGHDEPAVAGDAFSVEPGIYLEGRYGVRVEDIVVCTADGSESLNRTERDLRVISGR